MCSVDYFYRPQRSWAKVIFSQASVCPQGGGGVSASVHAGIYPPEQTPPPRADPPRADTPPEQTPPGADTPPGAGPPHPPPESRPPGAAPRADPPRADTPREQTHPPGADPPPREADFSIRSTSGRYASYWNAFLFGATCT